MKKLTVLYDDNCGMCSGFRKFFSAEPVYLELEFVGLNHPTVTSRFPWIGHFQPEKELVVVADTGEIYQGADAWIMVLYASRRFREVSANLSAPGMKGKAKAFCEFVSANRHGMSRFLGMKGDQEMCVLKGKI